VIALVLLGCGAPISNAVFYEDAAFLAVLPSAHELHAPVAFATAPDGSCDLLLGGVDAAAALDAAVGPAAASGDALRAEPADERSDVHRRWDPVTVAATVPDGVAVWWITAEIVRPQGGATSFTMDAATDADGDYAPIGSGSMSSDGAVTLAWDLAVAGELVGTDATGTLEASWTDITDAERQVDVQVVDGDGLPTGPAWSLVGTDGFAWSGFFTVTDDGAQLPGWTLAVQTEAGGRTRGQVWRDAEPLAFEACWDGDGKQIWLDGDAGIAADGDEAGCAVPAFPE
jgi:hypothetical protein